MYKGMIAAIAFAILTQAAFADTCPDVSAIKKDKISGWKAYDSDDGKILSSTRRLQFKNNIKEFALAEWVNTIHHSGIIHCYYRDQNGSTLEAYLAKDNFIVSNKKNYWYAVSGAMHCAANSNLCEFQKSSFPQLAEK